VRTRLANAHRPSEPAEPPSRGDVGNSKDARPLDTGRRTESGRIDEMIGALLEAVRKPGEGPNESAVEPTLPKIDDRVEPRRRAEPATDLNRWELAIYAAAFAALVLIAVAVGIVVGILADRLAP